MIYSIIYYFDKNLIPIQKKMACFDNYEDVHKSDNSHVKVGNAEIIDYQMKKGAPINKVDGSTLRLPLFDRLP